MKPYAWACGSPERITSINYGLRCLKRYTDESHHKPCRLFGQHSGQAAGLNGERAEEVPQARAATE